MYDNDDNDDNQPTGGSELSTAIPSTSEPRMSSLEIAKITEKQHRNVLRDIEKTLTEVGIDLPKFESIFLDSYKREQPCYLLPRRECDLIIQPLKRLSRAPTDDEAPAMLPEYRQWVHLVNAEIAKSIGGPCLYILADSQSEPPLAEWWLYEPGSPPELLPSTPLI